PAPALPSYRDLGFTWVAGGRHPGAATDNALIVFRDTSYLELLGFHEPRRDHRWWTPLSRGGGLSGFCVRTDDLAGDAKPLRQAGVEMSELGRGDRRRPDGVEVRWMWALARGAHRGVAPFLLAEDGPRDERVPRERAHANGVTGIGVVTVAVDDLPSVRRWYAAGLGTTGTSADMRRWRDRRTRVIALRGATVVPGLVDAHAHLDREGLKTIYPSLARCRSIADVQAVIRRAAAARTPGEWIVTMPIGSP